MQPLRVFIVDRSAVMRRLLSETLSEDPEIAIAGTVGNGHLALSRLPRVKPDLITLDLDLPGMDGLATVTEIRKLHPRLPVIMFSSVTKRGAMATLDALARGASDYVAKPAHAGNAELAREHIRAELIPRIKALCAIGRAVPQPLPAPPPLPRAQARIDIVAIGASTGGPNALSDLICSLPADFPAPIVIVQHMPPVFTRLLADRLRKCARLPVRESEHGERVQSGQVWIAPGGRHMTVIRKGQHVALALTHDPPENSCRPAVDVLFRSVAQAYGANALAVVLTGMGSDGTRGARAIREAGGEVFVQDQASSVVWGMPGNIVAASLADRICPLDRLASDIAQRVRFGRSREKGAPAEASR